MSKDLILERILSHLDALIQATKSDLVDWLTAIGTVGAVIVALFTIWLNSLPKKSKLMFRGVSIINQDSNPENFDNRKLLDVGRLIIKNTGKYEAKSVEAYIEKVIDNGEVRKDFIPMPLHWTHGELNKTGPIIRNIYPNQTVYLDIYNHIFDPEYTGESSVVFAVAAGLSVDTLSKMALGESEIIIKLYQESGQVDEIYVKTYWNGKGAPNLK